MRSPPEFGTLKAPRAVAPRMAETPVSGIRCTVCGVVLADEKELAEHREVHDVQRAEGEPTRPVHHCSFCSAVFPSPEQLRDHHRSAHGK